MAAILRLFFVFAVLYIVEVRSYTLYRWIVDSSTRFNYDPSPMNMRGVYNWRVTYPESCGGELQSPVDIQTDRVRYGQDLPCPQMLYTSSLLRGELKNNGHSATFEPNNERAFRLTNIPYRPGVYNLNDFHLHYGGVSGRTFEIQGQRFRGSGVMSAGSEHTIDGLRFEGELHFVFYNSKYRDLEEADNKTDGVVIVVLLVQKLPGNVVDSGETSIFSQFLERNIPFIAPYQQNMTIDVDLSMFFNRDCQFYTYFGSTTTPVCHESVQWFILREPIRVTENAWFQLTRLQSRGDFNARFGNYRNTQPINNRVIVANFRRATGPVLPSPNSEMVRPRSENMAMVNNAMMQDPGRSVPPEPPVLMDAMMGAPMVDNMAPPMTGNRIPPMANNMIPPMENNMIPMVDNMVPPMRGNRIPPMANNMIPPMENNMIPMIDNMVPPMRGNRIPPMANSMIPPMANNMIPRVGQLPSPMAGNRVAPMVTNQSVFDSMGMANTNNMDRPMMNPSMVQDLQGAQQPRMSSSDNNRIPMPQPSFMSNDMRMQETNQGMIQNIRPVPPKMPDKAKERQNTQRIRHGFPPTMNRNMDVLQGQGRFKPLRGMKDSFKSTFYASDIWKRLCALWSKDVYG